MDKLAVELLTAIFSLACTDGGYTASSLALVCRHIREVSRPLRFDTVALTGCPDQMQRFLTHLLQLCYYVRRLAAVHGTEGSVGPFPRLQTMIIQLDPPPPRRYCHGMPSKTYVRMALALWKSQDAASVPAYILPPGTPCHWEARLAKFLQEWAEWMDGRSDIWGVAPEYARGAYEGDTPPPYLRRLYDKA
ncbi:hypothetical protein BV20DRAFT_1051269 [Pilatotrama ljubarskyi]|nr:hypothetical protein BV20DRAFT_1051269 [Pilatotrama ljubarskyi]